jgi:hypothetical protein
MQHGTTVKIIDILCLGSSFLQAIDQCSSLVFEVIKKKLPYYYFYRDRVVRWIIVISSISIYSYNLWGAISEESCLELGYAAIVKEQTYFIFRSVFVKCFTCLIYLCVSL